MAHYFTLNDWVNDIFQSIGTVERRVSINSNSTSTTTNYYDPFRESPYKKVQGFPPLNVEINEDTKDFRVSFALAGVAKERVKLSFDDGALVLEIKDKEAESKEKWIPIHQGIKQSVSCTKRYQFPTSKYDTNRTKAVWNDGILQVTVPLREERKPQEIKIN